MALIETTMGFRRGDAPGATFEITSDGVPLTTYTYDADAQTVEVSETTTTTNLTTVELAQFLAEFATFQGEVTRRYLPPPEVPEEWSWEVGKDAEGEVSAKVKVGGEPLARISWSEGEAIRFKPRSAFTLSPGMFFRWWALVGDLLTEVRRLGG